MVSKLTAGSYLKNILQSFIIDSNDALDIKLGKALQFKKFSSLLIIKAFFNTSKNN